MSTEHLFSKYGHYEAELSLRGLWLEINERQPRAKKRRQLGLSAPRTGAASTQGPDEEVREQSERREDPQREETCR